MSHLKKFTQSVVKSHIPRRQEEKTKFFNRKRKPNSRLVPAYIYFETIVIYLVKVTVKEFKAQVNVLRNMSHTQNSLPLITNLFFILSALIISFAYFRDKSPVGLDLLSFSLIECNSIPYTFLLKTHNLLSFSDHELYFILSFCRLVNINYPKLCHL